MKCPQVSNFMQKWMWHSVISVALIATQKSRTESKDIAAEQSETAVEHRKYWRELSRSVSAVFRGDRIILPHLLVCMQMRNIPSSWNSWVSADCSPLTLAGAAALIRWLGANHDRGTSVDGHNTEGITEQNSLSRTAGMAPCKWNCLLPYMDCACRQ